MSEFLSAAFAMPTALYSVTLLFVLAYWMLAIVGLFDLETVDAGSVEGGDLDVDLDVDLDGPDLDLDVDLDGPDLDLDLDVGLDGPDLDLDLDVGLDGPDLDVGLEGPDLDVGLDGPDLDLDVGLDGPDLDVGLDGPDLEGPSLEAAGQSVSAFARVMGALGFHRVPLTVSLSFVILFGWFLCFTAMAKVAPLLVDLVPLLAVQAGAALGSFVGALPFASITARPFAPLFYIHKASRRRAFIGHTCELTTLRVDNRFGQAEISDGGAGLTVQVRCDHDNALTKGGAALVVSFDEKREAYIIEPLDTPRGQKLQQRVEQLRAARQRAGAKSSAR